MAKFRNLDLSPHWDRVSESYADARIREKLARLETERPQEGWRNVDKALKDAGVPPALRLHYITATAHLGRLGREAQRAWNEKTGDEPGMTPSAPLRNE